MRQENHITEVFIQSIFFPANVCDKWQQPCSLENSLNVSVVSVLCSLWARHKFNYFLGIVCKELRSIKYQFKGEKKGESQRSKSLLVSDAQTWNRNTSVTFNCLWAWDLFKKFYWLLRKRKKGWSPPLDFWNNSFKQRKKRLLKIKWGIQLLSNIVSHFSSNVRKGVLTHQLSNFLGTIFISLLKCSVSQGSPRVTFQQQKAVAQYSCPLPVYGPCTEKHTAPAQLFGTVPYMTQIPRRNIRTYYAKVLQV